MPRGHTRIIGINGEIYIHLDYVKEISPNKVNELAKSQNQSRIDFKTSVQEAEERNYKSRGL